MDIKVINTPKAPIPAGHYSQGTVYNGVLYVAGQVPVVPVTGEKITGSIEEQTLQVLNNLKSIVEAAGSDISRILKVTVFVSDIEYWPAVNKVYSEFFGSTKPARAIVPVKELHYGFKIEIDAIAAV